MADLTTLTLALPTDLVEAVRASVAAGDYADEAEVVAEALRLTFIEETAPPSSPALERFLREEVAAAYDEAIADPGSTVPAQYMIATLR